MKYPLPGRVIAVASFAVLVASCSTGIESASFMRAEPLPADAPVRVYSTQRPACAFDEVGIVTWRGSTPYDNIEKALERMRHRAREMGGHAIIGFSLGTQPAGTTTTVSSDSTTTTARTTVATQRAAEGVVIRFREGNCGESRSD